MRRIAALVCALSAALCMLTTARAQSGVAEETVRAAFLYRFASFVEWPPEVFPDAQAPLRLCVVGSASFTSLLESTVVGQAVGGRAFEVRRLSEGDAARDCHIVYATGALANETLHSLNDRPVLTVTDAASGSERGMVHFATVQNRVRFHIDDAQAAESGLFISSRLLSLAVSVRRRA